MYDYFLFQLFTFVPTITFGLFEQDTTARARLEVPTLYIPSQQGHYFNSKVAAATLQCVNTCTVHLCACCVYLYV